MRYDDASQSGSIGHSEPVARPDEDRLPPGSFGPATGNAITGAGTTSGASGADSVGAGPATITAVQGAGGQTVSANGAYQASGQYGLLSMDMQGNFSYVRNPGTPDGVKDVFNYTLADATGANSSTTLTIDIGQVAAAAAGQGIVNLPQGVELSDIHVNGRDLIVNMPDGTQMVIPGGAVFVPQIVIGDVQVPPTNLAALLIDNEPQPAAGPTQSSGGNFADPVPPLDPGVPLGDLIPPTELHYTPPEFREIGQFEDTKPSVVIEPHDNAPGAVDAIDQVDEKGLGVPRAGDHLIETPGTGEIADGNAGNNSDQSESTFGQIVFTAQDGLSSVTVGGTTITAGSVGTTIHGQFGIMTITSVNLAAGTIGYTYTLSDNTSGNNTADHFAVVVTDTDGDTATATLTINIIDDVPIAHNDTDAIVGNDQSTDGNVMTGVGTTSGAAGADVVGADNATVTGAHPGSATGSFTAVPQDGSGVTIHGTFGDLVLHDDGSYTYTRSDIHQGGTDVFTYQLTDGDGDTATATLTITVPQVNTPPDVRGSDVSVSEEGLAGGNPDNVGNPVDNTNSATASSSIFVHDADGDPLTVTLGTPSGSFTSGGVPITWALSNGGHTLTGSAGQNSIITVTIHNDGTYDVTLSGPIDHPSDNGEQVLGITVPVDVSDGIAPPVGTTIGISIEDDSPVVTQADVSVPSLTVDETNLGIDASASFASVFDVSFGGDGPAALNSLVYTLGISASGTDSGLVDTASGNHVFLFLEGGQVIGREGTNAGTAAGGPVVFTVSVNSTTGVVTLDQERAVVHPTASNPDSNEGVTLASSDLVTLSVTATDRDSDQASQTVNIGQQLTFQDDGPTISAGGEQPSLTVDETNLAANDSASFAGIFTGSFGADGAGTIGYALGISSSGADSGLVDTASGNHVFLFLEGGEVVGREGTNAGTAAAGPIVFTVSIDANTGVVTLDQIRAVVHPNGTNPDTSEGVTLSSDNLVTVLATITDKDGDSATASANIGQNLNFQDDGPTISASATQPDLTVDETNLAVNATGSFAGVFTSSFGADGAGTIGYTLGISSSGADSGLVDTASGNHVFLFLEGGEVVGREGTNAGTAAAGPIVFTVSIDSSGNVTLDQIRAVVHPTASNPDSNESVSLSADNLVTVTATITDKDGDSATATANIGQNLHFQDDGPTISASTTQPDLTVDETNLAVNASSSFASVFTSSFGADGAGTIGYALNISASGADSGLVDTASGNHVFLFLESGQVVGREGTNAGTAAAGPIVFTVSIDSSGNVTLDQIRAVVHPTATNPDSNEGVTLSADNLVTVTATITDKDGDSSTATANIGQNLHFQDDGPTAHSDTNTVNEGATVTGNVETNDLFGADGKDAGGGVVGVEPGSHLSDTVTTGVGSPITGTWGTLTLQADGSYSYHANPNTNPPPGSTDVFTYTIKDGDGDTSTTTLTITVNDVTASVGSATTFVSEEVLPVVGTERNGDTDSDPTHDVLVNSGNITLTDSLGGATFTTALTAPSGTFTSGGTTIVWTSSNGGHTMTGTAGGNTVIVATIDNSGHYTVTLSGPIDTPNGVNAGENGGDQIVVFGVTATDNLGNTLTPGTLTVHVEDDAPTIDVTKGSDSAVSLTTDDADTIGTNTDHATSTANFGGVFGLTFQTGADGTNTTPTLAYTLGVSSPGVDSGLDSHGSSIFLYLIGGVVVGSTAASAGAVNAGNTIFDVSVNSSGQVTLDQFQQIDHPLQAGANDAPFNDQSVSMADSLITLTASSSITDKDNDTATDSETVNIGANLHFTDDGPTAAIATTGQAISVDETPGIQADANDVAGPLAAFAGVTNVGTDPNMPAQYAANANAILTTTGTTYGADGPGTTVLSLNVSSAGVDSGLNTTDGHDILLFKEGDLIVGRVSGGTDDGKAAFAIAIDQTGHLSMVEYLSIQHPNTASADESVTIANGAILAFVNVTDFDGDTAQQSVAIGGLISFQDDGPTLGTVQNQQTDNNPATAPAVGTLHFTPGADGAGSTMTITADNTGITSGGHALLTVQTGNVLTAYQDTNNDGIHQVGETTVVYTLTVNPSAGTSGQYVFDLVTPLDPTVTNTPIGGSSSFGAGPTLGQTLTDGATPTPNPLSVVSGYHPTATFDPATWFSTGSFTGTQVTSAGVNGSTIGWGVDNNNFETNSGGTLPAQELMYFDFGHQALSDPDGSGSFAPPSVTLPNISFANFNFSGYKAGAGDAGDDIAYVVHYVDASGNPAGFASGFVPDANLGNHPPDFTISAPAGLFIADVEFYSGIEPSGATQDLGAGKITLVSVGVTSSTLDVTPSFTVQLTDGDGDPTATAGFNVHVATGLTPFAPAAPVVLDLNGDGVHFLGTEAGVTYNYGHGEVATAWVSPQDGILVNDANHDGQVTANEFVFGGNGATDLQALAAFDTNHDGQLSSADASFANFAVWQDANSNGVVDPGELQTLTARGITSISLSSDGIGYSAAGGDVQVAGTGTYTKADGSTGVLADAAFQTGSRTVSESLNSSTALASNAALIGAVAAAGLEALQGIHSDSLFAHGIDHASVSLPVHDMVISSTPLDSTHVDSAQVQLPTSASNAAQPTAQHSSGGLHDMVESSQPLTPASNESSSAPTELLHGSEGPAHAQGAIASAVTAMAVAMPSAEQLAAVASHGVAQAPSSVGGAAPQHDQVVSKVLVDALHGGGSGPNIDGILNAVSSQGASHDALQALASHGAAAVSFGHTAFADAFGGAHGMLSQAMIVHPDAVAPVHG